MNIHFEKNEPQVSQPRFYHDLPIIGGALIAGECVRVISVTKNPNSTPYDWELETDIIEPVSYAEAEQLEQDNLIFFLTAPEQLVR